MGIFKRFSNLFSSSKNTSTTDFMSNEDFSQPRMPEYDALEKSRYRQRHKSQYEPRGQDSRHGDYESRQQGYEPRQQNYEPTQYRNRHIEQDEYFPRRRGNINMCYPKKFEDIIRLIDAIKFGEAVIVDLAELPSDMCQKMLDFMSGAIYALGGNMQRISGATFLFTPPFVKVNMNLNRHIVR